MLRSTQAIGTSPDQRSTFEAYRAKRKWQLEWLDTDEHQRITRLDCLPSNRGPDFDLVKNLDDPPSFASYVVAGTAREDRQC